MKFKIDYKLIILFLLLSGCSNYQYNENFPKAGPMFVLEQEPPAPEPIPEPEPEPEPLPEPELTITEQNTQAVEVLSSMGFDTEESEKGVVVYLPPNIYFTKDKADINLDARAKIAEISSEVNKDYLLEREIEVSGHTDTLGDASFNMGVSKLRAEAAAAELVFSKVALTRIKTTWHGETKPRVSEYSSDGKLIPEKRALNRRVEFTILNPGQ